MHIRSLFALCGASIALSLTLAANAFAAGTQLSVRIEGKSHTLLPNTVVHTHAGSITKGGAAAGHCPATSAAGALDNATHGRWDGKYYPTGSAAGIFITSIFGVRPPTVNDYWTVFVDNRTAGSGICALKLHRNEQLLFAVTNGSQLPIVLTAPQHAKIGRPFKVRASYYTGKGVRKPLAGVRLDGAVTNRSGIATITDKRAGKLTLTASRTGYIRSAPTTVRVSS